MKRLRKRIARILDRYGVFNERPFVKKEYRREIVEELTKLINNYEK